MTIRFFCAKCWHRWDVVMPTQNVERFCRVMHCTCGAGFSAIRPNRPEDVANLLAVRDQ